jgi:hypothetical protein
LDLTLKINRDKKKGVKIKIIKNFILCVLYKLFVNIINEYIITKAVIPNFELIKKTEVARIKMAKCIKFFTLLFLKLLKHNKKIEIIIIDLDIPVDREIGSLKKSLENS